MAAEDDFEFEAVPKFMDFQNDENDAMNLDRSAFFYADGPIAPTPLKPRTDAAAPLLIDSAKAKTTPPSQPSIEKNQVPAVLAEKNTFEEDGKKKPVGATSNLALFNPGASRLKERARRRSQQIQVQEEPPKAAPTAKNTLRRPVPSSPSKNQAFTRSRDIAPRAQASVERLAMVKNRQASVEKNPVPSILAAKNPLEDEKKKPVGATSNLALFNPGASRLKERARRRSQQIQVQEEPPKAAPTSKNTLRRPVPSTPPKNQPFASSRDAVIQASVERLSVPKNRQAPASDALHSVAGTPKKIAQPIVRRQSNRIGSSNHIPPKQTPDKPEAFKQKLRSYKPPTGKTPAKGLTVPQPYPFHRSRSQCRDAEAKAMKIDPAKLQESVNRLSAPKKRESAIGGAPPRRR